ncbi:MAG: phage major capsid protein [Eubacteriales bacterium]
MSNITTIESLRRKRAELWDKTKVFLDEHRSQDGLISAEDNATYEKMEGDVVALGHEVQRLERQEVLDREFASPTSQPITNRPGHTGESKIGRATDEYKNAFWKQMKNQSSYEVKNALQIGTDSEGGYLVPDEFERTLISALSEDNIFRQLAHVMQTSSGERKIPIVSTRGSASWIEEEGNITESDDVFGQALIGAYKLGTMIKVSEELLNDNIFDLQGYISKEFGHRIGNKEEDAFFNGNGSGKPTGIFNVTGGAQVGITSASATAITADEIFDLFYSLRSPYRKNSVFILNDSTIKALRKLKDGNGVYIWQPSILAGSTDTLMGKKIITSIYVPEIASGAKTIAFGDFSYYWIADRQGRSFKRLNELFATTGQVGFLATQRVDGKLILPEAVKVLQQHV